jgi:hypothetical protein
MKKLLSTTSILCMLSAGALAQTATGTGVGVGQSESNSAAGAVAVNRGNGTSSSSLTINNPASTSSSIRQELSGTQTVKNVPTAVAPSLAAAGIETCLGSVSGGGSIVGFGGSFGTTVPDPGCQARLDARTLWSMGLKSAAVARLCIREDIYRSMPDVCEQYRPVGVAQGYGVALAASDPALVAPPRGAIQVVEGRTGLTRSCDRYDDTAQKCIKWTGESKTRLAHKRPTTATGRPIVMTAKPKADAMPSAAASPAPAAVASGPSVGF